MRKRGLGSPTTHLGLLSCVYRGVQKCFSHSYARVFIMTNERVSYECVSYDADVRGSGSACPAGVHSIRFLCSVVFSLQGSSRAGCYSGGSGGIHWVTISQSRFSPLLSPFQLPFRSGYTVLRYQSLVNPIKPTLSSISHCRQCHSPRPPPRPTLSPPSASPPNTKTTSDSTSRRRAVPPHYGSCGYLSSCTSGGRGFWSRALSWASC